MQTTLDPRRALVLFSGGQDSSTCLAWALSRYDHVETVAFDYGQRHLVELEAREEVRKKLPVAVEGWAGRLGTDHRLSLPAFGEIGETAMTADLPIQLAANGLPTTFVPGRNIAFIAFAAALAVRRGAGVLVGGMCGTDSAGYPDCRPETMQAMAETVRLGVDPGLTLKTPLIAITKAQTWRLAEEVGGRAVVDIILEDSHTCYKGDRKHRHPWGYGCGECPACTERARGFFEWSQGT